MSGKLAERRQLRQVFLGELSAYLASGFGQDYSGVGDEIRQLFITIEDGYHKIWAARLTGPAGAMPAENRVGSVFTGAAQVMCRLDAESKAFLDSQKKDRVYPPFDLVPTKLLKIRYNHLQEY